MHQQIVSLVRRAGVVGAGGAGFPTHVKLGSRVQTYIVNGAECEPLLYKDKELMRLCAERLVHGLRLAVEATGASRGVIAVKAKYHEAIEAMQRAAANQRIELCFFDNFYPAGDEYVVVQKVTGRLIPPGGIPLQVGAAVNNVETLVNVSLAAEGVPVTLKALTVAGAVAEPASFVVPLGTTLGEVLALAGGASVPDPVALEGGAMMGRVVTDFSRPVTKTTGGYIVLPRDHALVRRKTRSDEAKVRIARSACDQCSFCTELCPRFLMGYAIEPHKVMRAVGFAGDKEAGWARLGLLCCECSLCELYSCPEDLTPREMCLRAKKLWAARGVKPEPLVGLGRAHPLQEARRVPVDRLIHRLGLNRYDVAAPLSERTAQPAQVQLPLRQHVGVAARPVVASGQQVRAGQLVADIPEGQLGAPLHAPIDGQISRIEPDCLWIAR
ncbi:MAG: hypothetical protein FJ125_01055 [Deltaproteobacteria bacterium]|nr:hypothetical protein [Deltaproteobacteria bacterium]